MKPFTNFESRVVALPVNNIDTDQIIPARFLKTTSKDGLGDQLFCDWRYDAQGRPKPDFALNQPGAKGAQVLLAGDNFGCGSSREHAPWALQDYGFRAIIAPSYQSGAPPIRPRWTRSVTMYGAFGRNSNQSPPSAASTQRDRPRRQLS